MSDAPIQPAHQPAPMARPLSDADIAFNLMYRKAKAFAEAEIIPAHFFGKVADCIVAFEYADLLRISPLLVMQSLYIVKGRASWSAQFMIGRANASGAFKGRIQFDVEGDGARLPNKNGRNSTVPNITVTAWAVDAQSGKIVKVTVSMEDAILEGWTANEKYSGRALGEQMLCYRAATMLIRRTCPDVLMGGMTEVEAEDLAVVDMNTGEVVSAAPTRRAPRAEPRPEPRAIAEQPRVEVQAAPAADYSDIPPEEANPAPQV